jgi:hypothetical protein
LKIIKIFPGRQKRKTSALQMQDRRIKTKRKTNFKQVLLLLSTVLISGLLQG